MRVNFRRLPLAWKVLTEALDGYASPIDLDTNGLGEIMIDQPSDCSPLPSRVWLTQEQVSQVCEFAQRLKAGHDET